MSTHTTCAQCGTAMPLPTGRQARKRYCSDPCRKTAWRTRHRDDVPDPVPAVPVPTASRDGTPGGGQHTCPHCHQPLAIISVIVPAAAARINVPEVPMTPH